MIELSPLKHPSTNVHSIGFEGERRGNVHVQFHDKEGKLTVRGFYRDVQRALFNALEFSRKPGAFIHQNLKDRFEWVVLESDEPPEISEAREHPDSTLPDNLFIPADVINTVEAITACIDAQRVAVEKKGLFE